MSRTNTVLEQVVKYTAQLEGMAQTCQELGSHTESTAVLTRATQLQPVLAQLEEYKKEWVLRCGTPVLFCGIPR